MKKHLPHTVANHADDFGPSADNTECFCDVKTNLPNQERCFLVDHRVSWAGDGYFCEICGIQFSHTQNHSTMEGWTKPSAQEVLYPDGVDWEINMQNNSVKYPIPGQFLAHIYSLLAKERESAEKREKEAFERGYGLGAKVNIPVKSALERAERRGREKAGITKGELMDALAYHAFQTMGGGKEYKDSIWRQIREHEPEAARKDTDVTKDL